MEVLVGSPYDPLELNQFKLSSKNIIEFLDINKSDSMSALAQLWEVELGRRHELVLTIQDGLWRYRLGDVVGICLFDPTDGVPSHPIRRAPQRVTQGNEVVEGPRSFTSANA
ncbi:hypothetical protein J3R83DRAFT_9391 [Lanmaoa asiatica]|nr:hypothetical protein J3R83DRAFT_9391 [Lanmaoa asiatica]